MRAVWSAVVLAAVAAFLIPGLGSAASSTPRLEVGVTGNGSVVSNDGRISCPPDCEQEYANQDTVELIARPASGETFQGWSQDCQGATKCTVVMTQDRNVGASFSGTSPQPSPSATASPSPSPTATASASPSPTASPAPTSTPAPSQPPGQVAAHLVSRIPKIKRIPPRPRALTIAAKRGFTCRRECVVRAVLRSGKTTLARGSSRIHSGSRPGATLRFTQKGRALLRSGERRARVTVFVQVDGRVVRRSRAITLRVRD